MDLGDVLLHATTGNGLTMMSNRLSWFYDLRGKFSYKPNLRAGPSERSTAVWPPLDLHSRSFNDGRHGLLQLTSRIVSRLLIPADNC